LILVDTSVWIDHLRARDEQLAALLDAGSVLAHPFVTGELALGNLVNRQAVIGALQELQQAKLGTAAEVLHCIGERGLFGAGIGYTDAHLLTAVFLTPGSTLWTRDKRLRAIAVRLGVATATTH
jgi:predicted nucleic acid-binding protein